MPALAMLGHPRTDPADRRGYRTIASRAGRPRLSMGASGSLKFTIKYPDMFCAAVAYGGGAIDLASTTNQFVLDILERNLKSEPRTHLPEQHIRLS